MWKQQLRSTHVHQSWFCHFMPSLDQTPSLAPIYFWKIYYTTCRSMTKCRIKMWKKKIGSRITIKLCTVPRISAVVLGKHQVSTLPAGPLAWSSVRCATNTWSNRVRVGGKCKGLSSSLEKSHLVPRLLRKKFWRWLVVGLNHPVVKVTTVSVIK